MNLYLLMPIAGLFLVFFQTSILNLLFMGRINVEMSLALVIYAGFRMNFIPGALLSFMTGFFLDGAMGAVAGLFALIYVCIFLVANLAAGRAYIEHTILIVLFTFLCSLIEGLTIVLFYKAVHDVNIFMSMLHVFLPQALVVSALSPLFFKIFNFVEALFRERDPQSAK